MSKSEVLAVDRKSVEKIKRIERLTNFINGEFQEPVQGKYLDNYDPAEGEIYSQVADSGKEDVDLAVDAAEVAFEHWSSMPAQKRSAIMLKIADLIDQRKDELALAESIDNGKPFWLAKQVDIPRASANFRFFGTAILHDSSESHHMPGLATNYTIRSPIGVAGCISPWNLPLYLFTWKIAPALAAGNTVIGKPSEITPLTSFFLGDICQEAGLPPGVLNIVQGRGERAGNAIIENEKVPVISFTGGTTTGKKISQIASSNLKKLSLELGGKNPNIIFDDCDFDQALQTSLNSSFSNQGQICLCGSRIFVQQGIYQKFKKAIIEKVKKLVVGDPLESGTDIGAVVSASHLEKILYYVDLAKQEKGDILSGGHKVQIDGRCKGGYFVEPTIIEGLDPYCRTNQEEIFGPVVTLTPFREEQEVIQWANSTNYGLSATIWTSNLNRAHRVAQEVKSGVVWVNCWLLRDLRTPFGGMKQSGIGREGGWEALRFFSEAKNICIRHR